MVRSQNYHYKEIHNLYYKLYFSKFGSLPISVGAPLQLLGHTSAGRVVSCTVLVGCASSLDMLQVAVSPRILTLFGGYRLAPEAPPFRGMPTGLEAFLKMPGACGLRPCARTHLKKALCHIHPVGGTEDNYRTLLSLSQV